jgi:hypothetical protein
MKISEKKFSFFLTLNQYFPHIPYVASKNHSVEKISETFFCEGYFCEELLREEFHIFKNIILAKKVLMKIVFSTKNT